jgi:hypothetical protein
MVKQRTKNVNCLQPELPRSWEALARPWAIFQTRPTLQFCLAYDRGQTSDLWIKETVHLSSYNILRNWVGLNSFLQNQLVRWDPHVHRYWAWGADINGGWPGHNLIAGDLANCGEDSDTILKLRFRSNSILQNRFIKR